MGVWSLLIAIFLWFDWRLYPELWTKIRLTQTSSLPLIFPHYTHNTVFSPEGWRDFFSFIVTKPTVTDDAEKSDNDDEDTIENIDDEEHYVPPPCPCLDLLPSHLRGPPWW